MRRLNAILLLLTFLLPFALPLLALGQEADAGLPACCRRNGQHRCSMNMGERAVAAAQADQAPRWQAPFCSCPYCPAAPSAVHADPLAVASTQPPLLDSFSHPAGAVQTESRWRIARDRSRRKRGPPAVS